MSGRCELGSIAAPGQRIGSTGMLTNELEVCRITVIADLVAPQRTEANELFAATWDQSAQTRSAALANTTEFFDIFQQEHWNYYRYPDPADRPSSLFEQLLWLKEANFAVVDCFWMQAGHAIYGGYKSASRDAPASLSFETALATARKILEHQR